MPFDFTDAVPIEEPMADLERRLIAAYVTRAGQDVHDLRMRTDVAARTLLTEASRYASARLSEIEARFRYLRALHGETLRSA